MKKENKTTWEEEFDERFKFFDLEIDGKRIFPNHPEYYKEIILFIHKTIKQELKKFADYIKLKTKQIVFEGKLKPSDFSKPININYRGYNQAVQELNQKIKEYLEDYEKEKTN